MVCGPSVDQIESRTEPNLSRALRPDRDGHICPVAAMYPAIGLRPPSVFRPRLVKSREKIPIAQRCFSRYSSFGLSIVRAKRGGPKRPSCGRGLLKGNTIIPPRRCSELFAALLSVWRASSYLFSIGVHPGRSSVSQRPARFEWMGIGSFSLRPI